MFFFVSEKVSIGEFYYLCIHRRYVFTDEKPRKHIKAENSNKNG